MKKLSLLVIVCVFSLVVMSDGFPLAVVRHRWQEVITESNHAALRPGSVYDILTHFEQDAGIDRPHFNYLFFDTGLGAADPIYPVFQTGYQESWPQLIKAGLSEENRHLDHFSTGDTPEGCRIQSVYWVRHINEFPDMYAKLRDEGYTLVDISFDYYVKLRPDAQCGKHKAHDLSENFDPFAAIYGYAETFKTFADIPPDLLEKYEAKVGVLKLISQDFETSRDKWATYGDTYNLRDNSMWFYPDAFQPDYGIDKPRQQGGLEFLNKPRQLFFSADAGMQARFPLRKTLAQDEFAKLVNFWEGQPVKGFDPKTEPGEDTLDIRTQVTPKNFYTSGTTIEPISDVIGDVTDPDHFKLVSAVLRPAEPESDIHFHDLENIPQIRFVYQLMSPRFEGRPYEQLFVHLSFDAVDRLLPLPQRQKAIDDFLIQADRFTGLREGGGADLSQATIDFIEKSIKGRPVQTLSWSSSLTGIWVFGILSRSYNEANALEAIPIIRDGVNVGFYSSAYDNVLFRSAAEASSGDERASLQHVLDDLTPQSYRDPKRHDPEALTFHRMTCAQCHQMAGRDGVHVLLNDNLDRRIATPYRATEYLFRELDRQLKALPAVSKAHG